MTIQRVMRYCGGSRKTTASKTGSFPGGAKTPKIPPAPMRATEVGSRDLLRYDDDGPTFAQLRSSRLRWACQESDPNHERTCVAATQIVCWSPSVTNGGAVQTRGTPSSRTTEAAVHATALQAMDDVSSTSTNEELRLESMSTSRGQSSSTRTAQGLARSREKGKRRRIDSPSPDTASSREPTAARENKKDLAIRQLIEAIRSNSLHARCTSQELSDKMTSVGFATLEQRRQTTGTQFGVSVDGSAGSTQDQLRLIAAKMGQLHARNSTSSGARRASKNMPWEMISRDCARLMRHLQRFETLEMTSTQRRHHTLSGIQAWFDAKKWYISLEDLRCRAQDITRVYAGKQRNLNMVFAILEVDPTKVGFEAVNGKTKVQYLCNLDHKSPGAVARSTYCLGPLVRFAAISRHLFGDTSLNVSGVYDPVPVFLVPYKKAYMETAGNAAPESLLPWPPSTSNTEASPSSGKSEHSPTQEEIHFFRVLLHLYHLSLVVRYASRQADVPKVLQWLLEDELFFLSENDVNWSTAAKRPRAYFKDVRLETCSHSSPPLPS
ncbi:hypothetical protein IE81DRAFT_346240 [Ceraceosorus guamensis]|uniref:Uncharacterized protein n=1 Tax=Ceraceosorus guamensis TaxID=1522189 RepID=A0A316W6Z2_9BASI|nr:hypothetical protein IE81DRAFT_346240 [Ceraceosorus guamensis]PWN43853.1 hypothetical protein IE81DRAFT_346240 [Ceraceosorus guamensis]